MSNPKAKLTCYGIHSMPCYRYHQTMHAIGTSHNCMSCIQTDEMHDQRHRKVRPLCHHKETKNQTDKFFPTQIAELVAEYNVAMGTDPSGLRDVFQRLNINNNPPQQAADEDAPGEEGIAQPEDDDEDNEEHALEPVITEDTTASSEAMPPPKLTKADIRAQKKAAKSAKSQSKAAKNQKRHTINVRSEDVALIARILHGDSLTSAADTHPLASDKEIDDVIKRNLGYVSSIEAHKKQLLSSIAQKRRTDQERRRTGSADETDDDMEGVLAAILAKLGVDAAHISTSAAGSGAGAKKENRRAHRSGEETAQPLTIVASMKALIKDDLERFTNEQKETCVRAGAFWRYAGKPIFDRMTRIAMEVDWKTGMKLKDREE